MTAWHRLLRTALRRQGGFSPELETWISGLAAVERARSYDAGSAGPSSPSSRAYWPWDHGLLATPKPRPQALWTWALTQYVQAPRSTLMQARDLLERLSSGVEDQTEPFLPSSRGDAAPTGTTAPPGVLCVLAEILSLGPGRDQLDYALTDAKRVVAELAKVGWKITAKTKGPDDLASEPRRGGR